MASGSAGCPHSSIRAAQIANAGTHCRFTLLIYVAGDQPASFGAAHPMSSTLAGAPNIVAPARVLWTPCPKNISWRPSAVTAGTTCNVAVNAWSIVARETLRAMLKGDAQLWHDVCMFAGDASCVPVCREQPCLTPGINHVLQV